jgi:3-oxoadipate enol-lactonase
VAKKKHTWPPVPPFDMPPARTVRLPDRGEFFLRDTGGDGPVVMLLHGWMASADLNWSAAYGDLQDAGYRVLAIDHRGHGRGLRPMERFRLRDCAADAAAVLRFLELAPAVVAGYSMGGAIAQLVAYEHADVVRGLVLSGTALHWQDKEVQRRFRALGVFGLTISVAPRIAWQLGFRATGLRRSADTAWLESELMRHSASDITEAGRELGRFDARPWASTVKAPVAVALTTKDDLVPPRKQRQLAEAYRAQVFEAPVRHIELGTHSADYNPALLQAIAAVSARHGDVKAA